MWTPHYYGAKYSVLRPMVLIYYGVILILFLAVLLPVTRAMFRRGDPVLIIHVLIIATTATALVFHGQHRYRFPIDPLLFCFAGAGLAWLIAAFADRSLIKPYADSVRVMWRKPTAVLAAGAIVVLCVWTNSDNSKIEDFRTRVCGERIHKIQLASQAYLRKHNRPPESVESLVPEHLENLQALHCPIHSLDYCDYELMGSTDTTIGKKVISYRLVHDPTKSESITVAHESLGRAHPARERNHIRTVDLVIKQTVLAESTFRLVKGAQ